MFFAAYYGNRADPNQGGRPVKEVQDHYFKKAKKEGYPARSVYKLEEAQIKHGLLKKATPCWIWAVSPAVGPCTRPKWLAPRGWWWG